MQQMIRVQNVSKHFLPTQERSNSMKGFFTGAFRRGQGTQAIESFQALKDITFQVHEGEFFGIVGRNGSGKSTLLKILAGIYQPSDGNVKTKGRLVPFIELGVGFNPELTGKENVYLNGAMLGFSRNEVRAMYDDIVGFAELEGFMEQKLKNYSSGMQVRLAFSMATRSHADILLIDEVLAVGDADFQRKCFNYFKELKRQRKTVVFVSHDMSAVREYCDRAVLLEKSVCKQMSDAHTIADAYEKLFLRDVLEASTTSTDEGRWGDGQVTTSKLQVTVRDKHVILRHELTAHEAVSNPIPGFRIRDASGKDVTGTNTKIEGLKLGEIRVGQIIVVEWKIPNVFADGDYYVDPAVLLADGITIADWWDEAASFTIRKNRRLPYIIDPGFTVKKVKS